MSQSYTPLINMDYLNVLNPGDFTVLVGKWMAVPSQQ